MNLQLKRLRKEAGMTQEDLAARLGVTKRVIGTWERQDTQITLEDACSVSDLFGCTPNDLCGWYIDHPEDAPGAVGGRADPRRQAMVDAYDALTDDGKTLASETVASLARDPLRRADAAGGSAGHGAAQDREELSA